MNLTTLFLAKSAMTGNRIDHGSHVVVVITDDYDSKKISDKRKFLNKIKSL